jgi:hypothetical protein
MAKHNKKRNVGIIYEQLLKSLSEALVNNNSEKSKKIKNIIKVYFKPGTQLYKEFRLFNALIHTTVPSGSLAVRILEEAKKAAKNNSGKALEKEKSMLIKEINHSLDDKNFYSKRIEEYKSYATIQILLNNWRTTEPDISMLAEFEKKVYEILLKENSVARLRDQADSNVNRLTVKLMLEKFNKKYGSILNEEQVSIMKSYIFAPDRDTQNFLCEVKNSTLKELKKYEKVCDNKTIQEKIESVLTTINSISESSITDDNISKFLLLSSLKQEILEENHEK